MNSEWEEGSRREKLSGTLNSKDKRVEGGIMNIETEI